MQRTFSQPIKMSSLYMLFKSTFLIHNSLPGYWPVHLEVGQSHRHYIHNRRDLDITFKGLLGEAVLDRQQTEVSYNDVEGRGRLGQEDDGCIEVDVQSDPSAPLCQLLHTWRCLFRSLDCHLCQGLFSLLEVIDECLRARKNGKQQSVGEKLIGVVARVPNTQVNWMVLIVFKVLGCVILTRMEETNLLRKITWMHPTVSVTEVSTLDMSR